MNEDDIINAPIFIMLTTWLNNLMHKKHAEFNKENENIIDIDSYASAWFSIGRDNETLAPFIGVPKNFMPWFVQIGFEKAFLNFKNKRLYLSCGSENEEGITISFKIRKERMNLLWHKTFKENDIKQLDFRAIAFKADGSEEISEKSLHACELKLTDDLFEIVKPPIENIDLESEYADEIRSKFESEYASKYKTHTQDDVEW